MNMTVTNILYIDDSPDSVESFKKTIRKTNITANLVTADSKRAIDKTIQTLNLNLIVLNTTVNIIEIAELKALLAKLRASDINIVAIIAEEYVNNPFVYLNDGARFVSSMKNEEWLIHNIKEALNIDKYIKEYKQYEAEVVELKSRSTNLLEDASEPIAYLIDGAHIYANPAYLKLFGLEKFAELSSYTVLDLISAEDQKNFKVNLKRAKVLKTPTDFNLTGVKPLTEESFEFNFKLENTSYQNQPCQQLTVLIQKQDIHDLISTATNNNDAKSVESASESRLSFIAKIKKEQPKSAWLILLAFDDLNKVWYKKGIEACSLWINSATKVIAQLLGEGASLIEYSNSSILVLIRGCNLQESDRLTNSLRTVCEDHKITFDGSEITSYCHATTMALGNDITNFDEILKKIDRQSGILTSVNTVDDEDKEISAEGSIDELFTMLQRSLQEQQCKPYFIPIASFTDLAIDRYQIDFIIKNAEGEMVAWNRAPVEIYQHSILKHLDQWLVIQSIQNIVKALGKDPKGKSISIPLSATAAMDDTFYNWLIDVIEKSKIPPLYLSFGFSEELLLAFPKENSNLIQKLAKLGCKTYIYNFSTENLPLIDRYHIQSISISGRFINRISRTRDPDLKAQARKAITLIQQKNLKIIADGVDAAPQMATVWEFNLDFAQGTMISPPLEDMTFDFNTFAMSF